MALLSERCDESRCMDKDGRRVGFRASLVESERLREEILLLAEDVPHLVPLTASYADG